MDSDFIETNIMTLKFGLRLQYGRPLYNSGRMAAESVYLVRLPVILFNLKNKKIHKKTFLK